MAKLPDPFLDRPIAHRALHNRSAGRVENSMSAVQAAIARDFGIELDLQPSADGVAMVFHDDTLDRLTGETGLVRDRGAEELKGIRLNGGGPIPTLSQVLTRVRGQVPLLLEIKDQDGALGPDIGVLEEATAAALHGYEGPVAVMSFNPHAVSAMADLAPDIPRGLTTDAFTQAQWPAVAETRRAALREITDYDRSGACFISHNVNNLSASPVARLKAAGASVLCWTVRSPEMETAARRIADNITFEGYDPERRAP